MREFYEEGIKIGDVKFNRVLLANEQMRQIDETLINRCLMNGIEIIAMEDKEQNVVKYVSCRRPKNKNSKTGLNWKHTGGILRFWNAVKRTCSDFDTEMVKNS